MTAPGPTIALAGGVMSAVALALCGVLGWAASRSGSLQSPVLARTLADLMFATGGPAHVVAFGLLLAGVAVPALLVRLVPGGFAWSGVALAAVAVLGTLALVDTSLGIVLPIARFGGLIWLIAASVMLPREHPRGTIRGRWGRPASGRLQRDEGHRSKETGRGGRGRTHRPVDR